MTTTTRECGDCQLCCKLLPLEQRDPIHTAELVEGVIAAGWASRAEFAGMIDDFVKPAGQRCPYQRHHKGCTIYARRPFCCRAWNCRWLMGDDTADQLRPDRSHAVIDSMPDFITCQNGDREPFRKQVDQIWIDPSFPDAHRDPVLRRYVLRRAAQGIAALIRYGATEGFVLIAPPLSDDGKWHEVDSGMRQKTHSFDEIFDTLQEIGNDR